MKINQHIVQGFFISLILIITAHAIIMQNISNMTEANLVFYMILIASPYFILLGSIYPDTDIKAPWRIKTTNIFAFFFSLFKVFLAYPLRWFLYYPSFWIIKAILPQKYNIRVLDKHHGTTHTFMGIFVASIVLYIIVNAVIFLIFKNNYSLDIFLVGLVLAIPVCLGFLVGCFIHFIQDAYSGYGNSKYGIAPFEPFSRTKFYGDYSSFFDMDAKDRIMSVFIFLLLLFLPWTADYILYSTSSILTGTVVLIIFVLSVLITIFSAYGIEFNMRINMIFVVTN